MAAEATPQGRSSAAEFIHRVGRTSGLFGVGLAVNAICGIATIAVLTRVLSPAEYGRLAVLLVFSGLLSLLIIYVVLPGTMSWTLGAADEDDEGVSAAERTTAADAGVALFTGVAMMLALIAIALALVVVLREPLGHLLVRGDSGERTAVSLVLLGALNAVPTALTRLLANILRYAQRPGQYVVVDLVRPVAVLALAIALAATGGGDVHAVLLVYLAGGMLGVVLAAVLLRNDITPRASLHDARMIFRRGRAVAPAVFSNWVVLNTDVFFLAQFASAGAVGSYRVATGIGRLGSYVASTFIRAWGPMTHGPLAAAMKTELGDKRASAATLKYFVLLCCWTLVVLSAFSGVMIRLVPSSFRAAEPLIPVLASVYMLRVTFILSYHASERRSRRRWMFALFGVALLVFVASCLVLIPALGSWGAALAGVLAYGVATAAMLTVTMREPDPMPLAYGRIAAAIALAGAVIALQRSAGDVSLGAQVAIGVIASAIYPALLIVAGIVPRHRVRALGGALLAAVAVRRRVPGILRRRLAALDAHDLALLDALLRRREDLAQFAETNGEPEDDVRMRLVLALRRVSDLPPGHELRASMSRYVLEDESVVHHLSLSRRLVAQGCDGRALDALYEAARAVRAIPNRQWPPAPDGRDSDVGRRLDELSRL